jgi:hypothetical protein
MNNNSANPAEPLAQSGVMPQAVAITERLAIIDGADAGELAKVYAPKRLGVEVAAAFGGVDEIVQANQTGERVIRALESHS